MPGMTAARALIGKMSRIIEKSGVICVKISGTAEIDATTSATNLMIYKETVSVRQSPKITESVSAAKERCETGASLAMRIAAGQRASGSDRGRNLGRAAGGEREQTERLP